MTTNIFQEAEEYRLMLGVFDDDDYDRTRSDSIQPHEIPASLSMCDWMRTERECDEWILHRNGRLSQRD